MTCIDEHTFNEKLLSGGWVIDAGCRGWKFAIELQKLGHSVYCLDIEDFSNEIPQGIYYQNAALGYMNGMAKAHFFGNGTANFIAGINGIPYNGPDRPCETKEVECINLDTIYEFISKINLDILKLDIEGSEYGILESIEPWPKQITVEFHPHCHVEEHNNRYHRVLDHLSKWYDVSFHSQYPQYPSLDTLFIRRDLL